ncbi:hypothetical protein SB861_21200 [Paraburkholderia sp. SIMBA_049]
MEVPSDRREALHLWYHSRDGQETLTAAFDRAWSEMTALAPWAMPAHDARHALFKVPATALEYVHAERIDGFERVGVLGAVMHDYGRWAEERIFGCPGPGLVHARLSFLLAHELLADFDMPLEIRAQILHAVLHHTSGGGHSDSMTTKLTVSADRDQLYGPEIVLRLMHHPVVGNNGSSVYGEKLGRPVLDRLMTFSRQRLPGPLFSRQQHVDDLHTILDTFVLMAEPRELSEHRFALERGVIAGSPPRVNFNWANEWERAAALRPSAIADPEDAMATLLRASHVAPSAAYHAEALAKVNAVPPDRAAVLAGALTWINEQRIEQDNRQAKALRDILATELKDDFLVRVINVVLAGIEEAPAGE